MQDKDHKKKRKSGLHKEISSIFEGVPVPGKTEEPSGAAEPKQLEKDPAKPLAPEPRIPAVKAGPVKQSAHRVAAANETGGSVWQSIWLKIKNKLFGSESEVSSSKQKVMLVLIPILFIALIYVLMPLFKRPKTSKPTTAGPAVLAVDNRGDVDWKVPEPYPTTLRDPMQPSSYMVVADEETEVMRSVGSLIVKGIVYSRENPVAVVGTQVVHEGDVVSGASIVKINKDSVEFKMNDKKWVQKVQR